MCEKHFHNMQTVPCKTIPMQWSLSHLRKEGTSQPPSFPGWWHQAHSGALSFLEKQNTLCLSPKQHVWSQVNSAGLVTAPYRLNMKTLKTVIHINRVKTYVQGAEGIFVENYK